MSDFQCLVNEYSAKLYSFLLSSERGIGYRRYIIMLSVLTLLLFPRNIEVSCSISWSL